MSFSSGSKKYLLISLFSTAWKDKYLIIALSSGKIIYYDYVSVMENKTFVNEVLRGTGSTLYNFLRCMLK